MQNKFNPSFRRNPVKHLKLANISSLLALSSVFLIDHHLKPNRRWIILLVSILSTNNIPLAYPLSKLSFSISCHHPACSGCWLYSHLRNEHPHLLKVWLTRNLRHAQWLMLIHMLTNTEYLLPTRYSFFLIYLCLIVYWVLCLVRLMSLSERSSPFLSIFSLKLLSLFFVLLAGNTIQVKDSSLWCPILFSGAINGDFPIPKAFCLLQSFSA